MGEVILPDAGPSWDERATELDPLAAVLDPEDRSGAKNSLISEVQLRALGRAISGPPGRTALDFGCGTGRVSTLLCDKGARVVGIDASEKMISVARAREPRATFSVASDTTGFPDAAFDVVVTVTVLQYLVSAPCPYVALLQEFARIMRPGGRLLMVEQVHDGTLPRGGPEGAYLDGVKAAGLEALASRPIRVSDSRAMYLSLHRRWMRRAAPLIMEAEARRSRGALAGGRYIDLLMVASKPFSPS